mmetsp:Transcript_20017/g.31789  ORF Transcript_20017/g.31789 Transcript_20017/m.31789 type:complete len:360 (-) Transcript_20017:603-1682(-)|eukprot:CAMPEP_0197034116 /NCGR_PEP_ID=MMETSP1384-20130603/12316_1 /TAXON_ID=29189 /ORGANISM="Ammonia sp." /LENGTH=359 /DNA_ID=CAMNT_0042464001 /DNA_START=144 /DNA_END=1223 /DNA_ORIENTATION=-
MNEDTLRKSWIAGNKVEIYSFSKNEWFTGKIVNIFIDEEGEWLEIKYNKTCSKQVQRYSINVRPHPKYYDEERTKLLLHGYLRVMQYEYLMDMIPLHVHVGIFQFYFLGVPALSDDDTVSSSDSEPDELCLRVQRQKNMRRIRIGPRLRHKLRPSTFTYPATKRARQNQQLSDIPETQPVGVHDCLPLPLPLYADREEKPFVLEEKLEAEDDYDEEDEQEVQEEEVDEEDEEDEMDTTMQMVESSPSPSDSEQFKSQCQALQIFQRETDWRLDVQRDGILCTMSELLFELTPMFKVLQIQSLSSELQGQLLALKQNMTKKKEYRKELLIFGYIRYIQVSITNKVIPIEVKKLCLLYYSE